MEFIVPVATAILNKLVNKAILKACYPFRFNKCIKELEIEKEKLQSKIQEVLDRAKDAKKKTHEVVEEVERWLNDANILMEKVVDLQDKTKRNKTSCLKHCPNLINRYYLVKQLEEKATEIKKKNEVQFSQFSRLAPLIGTNDCSSQDFMHFDSRKVAYDGLLRALKDDKIHMIGLYGMGGYGKTALAREVEKEAKNFFDQVFRVVVSNSVDVKKIQSRIASELKFDLKEEETPDRARRLFMRLSSGERILIILDDVWEKLDFGDIGIPTANNQTGCTTLITTRKFNVCELMDCQKNIPLEGLNEDESWALFQKYASLFDDHSYTLKDTAQEITKKCDGLPIAIIAVAKALKGKPLDEWVEALKTLRDANWIDIEEGLKNTYVSLRLSYDNLKDERAKSLFLLCSMYPEDYEIRFDQLTKIGLGLGLVGEISSYRARTRAINKAIQKLIDYSLLLKVDKDDNHVKMHDLVRDVALWIAKTENKLVRGQLKEDMIMKDQALRYLWFEEVDKCPNKLNCPELEFLYASLYSEPCVTIPKDFFNGTEKLRVIILENPTHQEGIALQLPISLHWINNLCCLMLYHWVLGDISFIGGLKRLESLTIWDCSFDELPNCIIQQKQLRLLDLRHCKIQRNPFEVMGRCSQLELLYFCGNSGTDWEDQNNNSAKFFDKISTNAYALESYCIHFGNLDEDFSVHKCLESLVARNIYIEDFENCISIATSKDMMRRAKTLSLRGIPRSCKNIIPDLWQTIGGGMNELTQLALYNSNGIECLISHATNPSQIRIISNLTNLTLSYVKNLKTLYNGQPLQGLFANLEELYIENCDSLQHILTEDVKEIVDGSKYQSYGNPFPKLRTLLIIECKQLQYLMPVSFAQSFAQLKTLWLRGNGELRSVFGQCLYEDLNVNKPQIIEFSALDSLSLIDLQNIISICPESYHPSWPSLLRLRLNYCPRLNIKSINCWVACAGLRQEDDQMTSEDLLKEVVAPLETLWYLDLINDEAEYVFDVEQLALSGRQVNLSLRVLSFHELPQLRHIWRGPKNSLFLEHLYRLQLVSCGNLKEVFPSSILKSFPQLAELYIEDCNELVEIVEEDDQNMSNSHLLFLPKLGSIYIKRCHKLKCVFPKILVCQSLRVLAIEDTPLVEQAFGYEQDTTHTYEVAAPSLEYVLLWNLPSLTSVLPSFALETVRYIVVQQCPKLSLTSSVTPQEMLKQLPKGYMDERYSLETGLELIIKAMDDSSRVITQQIDCKEIGDESNDKKLTFIASPNLVENKKESEDLSAHKRDISKEKSEEVREEYTSTKNVHTVPSLAHSEPASSSKTVKDLEIQSAPKETISKENIQAQTKFNPSNSDVEDMKEDDLISVLEAMKDEYCSKSPILSDPTSATAKDELVAEALADLEDSLKMPLKDIAASEANCLRMQTALNFLSHPSLEDGALSHDVTATIKSMHKDLPDILCSFKQAYATLNKVAVLVERDKSIKYQLSQRKEVAIDLVSKTSEAQEKEARLKEQISRLEKERKYYEAKLLSLQEQKKKYIAETVELKKEIETVRKEKSEMLEDQGNAQQQLFQANHKWSVLGSQFERNIADKISLNDSFVHF